MSTREDSSVASCACCIPSTDRLVEQFALLAQILETPHEFIVLAEGKKDTNKQRRTTQDERSVGN